MPKAPIDILHVVPAYWPRAGGIETLVAGMAFGLKQNHGISSAVITPRRLYDPQDEVEFEGVTIVPVPVPPIDELINNTKAIHGFFHILRKTYQSLTPKIIHIHGYTEITMPACIVGRNLGIPCIYHVHGVLNNLLSSTSSYFRELRTAEHVFAVSHAVATSIPALTGRVAPVTVIPNALRYDAFDPTRRNKIKENLPTVIMVGRLEEGKGFADGIKAIGQVVKAGKPVKTIIIGRGALGPMLQQLAEEVGLANLIEFKSEMSYAETQSLIGSADILLAPSRDTEGFSLVCLEAAFQETPVIGSSVGGIPETVAHDYSGLLIEPQNIDGFAQALSRYLDDPELARKHGLQARQRALKLFDYDSFITRWADEYRRIVPSLV